MIFFGPHRPAYGNRGRNPADCSSRAQDGSKPIVELEYSGSGQMDGKPGAYRNDGCLEKCDAPGLENQGKGQGSPQKNDTGFDNVFPLARLNPRPKNCLREGATSRGCNENNH